MDKYINSTYIDRCRDKPELADKVRLSKEVAMDNDGCELGRAVLAKSIEEMLALIDGRYQEPIQIVEALFDMALEDMLDMRPAGYVTTITVFAESHRNVPGEVRVVSLDFSGEVVAYRYCSPNDQEGGAWVIGTREDAVGEAIAAYLDRPDDSR